MNISLEGKIAFVCGSTQGIGYAAAIVLAELGAKVTLIARNAESLKVAVESLSIAKGQKHDSICVDFNDLQELKLSIASYLDNNDAPHILINNSGGPPGGPITEAELDEFDIAFKRHLMGNHIMTKAVIPGMKRYGYGRIINIISTSVKQPLNGLGVSNTIRGAVASWAKTMANELGQYGITVNNVLPGATNTARLQSIIDNKARQMGKTYKEIEAFMANEVPAKRFASPEEIGNGIGFLASPAAAYVNGINFPIDGGRTSCL